MSSDAFVSPHNDDVRAEQCHFCPRRDSLETHHVVPQRFNGTDSKTNLVVVCERCHRKLERLYDAGFYEALGIDDHGQERLTHLDCETHDCSNRVEVKAAVGDGVTVYLCTDCADSRDNVVDAQPVVDGSEGVNVDV